MNSERPEVSVVLAVRNAAPTLKEAAQSILHQSLSPKELILVLNGCTDHSELIAQQLAANNHRVSLLESSTRGGVAEAAMLGCMQTTSPLIARMDADDIAHPERLRHQVAVWQKTQADLITCQVSSLDSLGEGLENFIDWANGLQKPEDFRRERFVESPVIQPGVLMTRESYLAAGGYRVEKGPEDYDLWLRMLESGARFFQAPEALIEWRDSPSRLTRSHDDYAETQMRATKARYLSRLPAVIENGVILAGSGPIGRKMAKLLLAENIEIRGFIDVAPRKIGSTALGFPIWGPKDLGKKERAAILLGCVGQGKRAAVRTLAKSAGYREGHDFFACC